MDRPNILIFMTDQQRADSVYPFNKAICPNVQRFAQKGVAFSRAYTVSPHCCPSRATFFSGLYPSQHGVWNNVDVGNTLSRGLYEGVKLFTEDLAENGYRVYYTGKWHVSAVETPLDRGADYYTREKCLGAVPAKEEYRHVRPSTYEWGLYDNFEQKTDRRPGEIVRKGYPEYLHYSEKENPKDDDDKVADAVNVILNRSRIDEECGMKEEKRNNPWCQYIGVLGPHDPYEVPKEFLDLYDMDKIELQPSFCDSMKDKPGLYRKTRDSFDQLTEAEHKDAIRHYLAYCSYVDSLFGKVLDALEESKEADNTLVIFLSDHGDYMTDHGLWCKGLPCFEGAYHIPLICNWPKGIQKPGRMVDDFVTLADLASTILEASGVCPDRYMAGHSLMPYLKAKENPNVQEEVYTQSNGNELYGIQRSIMTKSWKYVYNGFDYDELYNLEEDPCEMKNVIDQYKDSELVKELCSKLWSFARQQDDVCVNPYVMVALATYGPGATKN